MFVLFIYSGSGSDSDSDSDLKHFKILSQHLFCFSSWFFSLFSIIINIYKWRINAINDNNWNHWNRRQMQQIIGEKNRTNWCDWIFICLHEFHTHTQTHRPFMAMIIWGNSNDYWLIRIGGKNKPKQNTPFFYWSKKKSTYHCEKNRNFCFMLSDSHNRS